MKERRACASLYVFHWVGERLRALLDEGKSMHAHFVLRNNALNSGRIRHRSRVLASLLDLLYPKHSPGGSEGTWITSGERLTLEESLTPVLLDSKALRRKELRCIDAVIAAGSYNAAPLLRKAILTFKYKRIPGLAVDLADFVVRAIPGHLLPPPILWDPKDFRPVLCPVPLHWTREFWRGFNQAELLAQEIGHRTGFEVRTLLRRTRPTGHQARRGRDERLVALIDAFSARKDTLTASRMPGWVVLVDDLCTTGTTLNEAAKALKKAGVKWVSAVVVAYG